MQIMNVDSIDMGIKSELVTFSVRKSLLDTPPGKPIGESVWIVIATVLALCRWSSAEFRSPDDQGFIE
jgi:hypothetical protein